MSDKDERMGDGVPATPGGAGGAGGAGVSARSAADAAEDPRLHQMEVVVSWVLRIGVVVSVAIVLAGLVLTFVHHPNYSRLSGGISYHDVIGQAAGRYPHSLHGLVSSLAAGEGRGVIVLGLVVLLATPVLRVVVGVVGYALERDVRMVVATTYVLVVLLASILFLGR
ncbi:MAG: DUF1634 domain-containing protein [Actinomycetota bacterium]|nr:DUF1634 domain-containing protein [Actinomycetota bacterium]